MKIRVTNINLDIIPHLTKGKVEWYNSIKEFMSASKKIVRLNKQLVFDFLTISSFFRFGIIKLRDILRVRLVEIWEKIKVSTN